MAKRIGLVGYYNYGNYGDDLFKEILSSQIAAAEFVVLDPPRLSGDAAYRDWFESAIDGVVLGGGDVLIPSGWASWYFSEHLLRKPVFVFGVGVPTWAGVDAEVVAKLAAYFRHPNIRLIGVRDIESRDWVERNLAPALPVQHFTDMVCAMPLPEVVAGAPVFTLITRHQPPGEIAWANVKALCAKAAGYGYEICNLVLGTGSTADDDLRVLQDDRPDIAWRLIRCADNAQLTAALGASTAVASMKFHGCVVAAMFGIPAIGLSTTDKFTNFFRQLERLDLRGHHTDADLAERLPKYPARVPRATTNLLREDAVRGLRVLEQAIAAI